ncbi:hypothetical protein AXG89_30290 (plasmid) [Burkholderia sp. PAMC 26561]|nr:hypothetical protein AXG89_30290 [Burkholderia sp. PAMC 26561]
MRSHERLVFFQYAGEPTLWPLGHGSTAQRKFFVAQLDAQDAFARVDQHHTTIFGREKSPGKNRFRSTPGFSGSGKNARFTSLISLH